MSRYPQMYVEATDWQIANLQSQIKATGVLTMPTFTGKEDDRGESLDRWLQMYAGRLRGAYAAPEIWVRLAALGLKEDALGWWDEVRAEHMFDGWDDFVELIKMRFVPPEKGIEMHQQWVKIAQGSDETVDQFTTRFKYLAKAQAYEVDERNLMFTYVMALRLELRKQVRQGGPKDMEDAARIARIMEDLVVTEERMRPQKRGGSKQRSDEIVEKKEEVKDKVDDREGTLRDTMTKEAYEKLKQDYERMMQQETERKAKEAAEKQEATNGQQDDYGYSQDARYDNGGTTNEDYGYAPMEVDRLQLQLTAMDKKLAELQRRIR